MNDHCNDDFMYGVCASRGPLGDFICPLAALGGQVSAAGSTQLVQTPFWGGHSWGWAGACLPLYPRGWHGKRGGGKSVGMGAWTMTLAPWQWAGFSQVPCADPSK